MDWERDTTLNAWIASADRCQRYQAAAFALRRLRAPLLQIGMPAEWGLSVSLVEALTDAVGEGPSARVAHLAGELRTAPLFRTELDPETPQLVQLETLDAVLTLAEAQFDPDETTTERIILMARGMAYYLDELTAASLAEDPLAPRRGEYSAQADPEILAYGLGYLGSRNLDVELRCREAAGLLRTDLVEACDRFSSEVLIAIRAL